MEAKNNGDSVAQTIVVTHDLYVRHPDRIALTLLECAIEDWQKREEQT